jgi:hypothetical protein
VAAVSLALLSAAPPAFTYDQTDVAPNHPDAPKLDPVTNAVERDPLTLLRLAAAALENPREQGEALAGIIGAFLKRDRPRDAAVDLSIIKDPFWRAQALVYFAEFEGRKRLTAKAQSTLGEALRSANTARPGRDRVRLFRTISRKQLALRDVDGAIGTARRIPDPAQRIAQLLDLGKALYGTPGAQTPKNARKIYRAAFSTIKTMTAGHAGLFLDTAEASIAAGDSKTAVRILEHTYRYLKSRPAGNQMALVARTTAAFVDAGRKDRAMEIVRGLPDDAQRAASFASIARAVARRESVEGAVSLFFLALRDASAITDEAARFNLLQHIIVEQTRTGRLADAFSTGAKITDPPRQHRALFAMGMTLLENGQSDAALKLVDYVPDIGMRARLFIGAARQRKDRGDKRGAAALLQRALEPTNSEPTLDMLAQVLPEVFELQVELGHSPGREKIFARARKLLEKIPDEPDKVRVLTRLARAEARDKQKDAVERSLGFAWRLAWLARDNAVFPALLHEISMAQLDTGDLLMAFDTAARIPEGIPGAPGKARDQGDVRERPKNAALQAVAIAAVRQGRAELALRAMQKINDPAARASAYGAVALALPIRTQQAWKRTNVSKPGAATTNGSATGAKNR